METVVRQRCGTENFVSSCPLALQGKGYGAARQEEQGRLWRDGDNTGADPRAGWVWRARAGQEHVPSCGWETFPVSWPGGSLIIIYTPQAARRPAREQRGAGAGAQPGDQ